MLCGYYRMLFSRRLFSPMNAAVTFQIGLKDSARAIRGKFTFAGARESCWVIRTMYMCTLKIFSTYLFFVACLCFLFLIWKKIINYKIFFTCNPYTFLNIEAAFREMHVSPAKHSYAWLPRKCDYRTDTRTDRQTLDKVIPMCCYASQVTPINPLKYWLKAHFKSLCSIVPVHIISHCKLSWLMKDALY